VGGEGKQWKPILKLFLIMVQVKGTEGVNEGIFVWDEVKVMEGRLFCSLTRVVTPNLYTNCDAMIHQI
jgi:hypothetical protein